MKKIVSAVLSALIILFSVSPVLISNASITTGDIRNSLEYYKTNIFRDGSYWCGGNPQSAVSGSVCGRKYDCICNSFAGAYQCHGFALNLANNLFGSYPAGTLSSYYHGKKSNGWTCYTKSALGTNGLCALGLQSGDIVRAATDSSYGDGHTAVCWKVDGDTAFFAECWGSSYCKIKWGGFNFRFYSLSQICANYTYVALWRNDAVIKAEAGYCNHTYIQQYEQQHPHAGYMQCSKCADKYYNNTKTVLTGCLCCQGIHSYTQYFEEVHPHSEVKVCTLCQNCIYTGNTRKVDTCKYCQTPPYGLSCSTEKQSYGIGDEVVFKLQAYESEKSSLEIYRDGVICNTLDVTNQSAVSFSPLETGTYYAKLICENRNGTALPVTCASFTVLADLDEIITNEDFIFCLYKNPLSESNIRSFCKIRGTDLALYGENDNTIDALCNKYPDMKFAVEDVDSSVMYVGGGSEYGGFVAELCRVYTTKATSSLGGHTYIVYPFSMPYNEAKQIADKLGTPLASITSEEENSLVASLIKKAGLSGAFVGANDFAEEGVWKWDDGEPFTYTNWNLSYTGFANKTANCLYMYNDGTWIDSPSTPVSSSGFVCEIYTPFKYRNNGDGTVTLTEYLDEKDTATVPEAISSEKVTAIAKSTFAGRQMTEITIPASVVLIEDGAFDDCKDTVIKCTLDSYAYNYAKANGIKYKLILPFSDVNDGNWYTDAVSYCYEASLMNGVSQTEFSPNSKITRAMFVTVLSKLDNADTKAFKGKTSFLDVATDKWYAEYIEWAYQNGYASGYGAEFKPNAPLSREQLAMFLYAYSEKNGLDVSNNADMSVYEDRTNISLWAYDAVSWACAKGLITGVTPTSVSPLSTATRAQTAVIVKNYIEKIKKPL